VYKNDGAAELGGNAIEVSAKEINGALMGLKNSLQAVNSEGEPRNLNHQELEKWV